MAGGRIVRHLAGLAPSGLGRIAGRGQLGARAGIGAAGACIVAAGGRGRVMGAGPLAAWRGHGGRGRSGRVCSDSDLQTAGA